MENNSNRTLVCVILNSVILTCHLLLSNPKKVMSEKIVAVYAYC